ncbi:MAG TPA: carbonic anhydrase, partial [Pirellulales bacterium]|nr:carbonic anhydrase [Pirellulales bacterium]
VTNWLAKAGAVVERAKARGPQASGGALLKAVIEENVLMQMEHLQTYPAVRAAAAEGRLRLHAWVYAFERGEVTAFDAQSKQFVPLVGSARHKLLVPTASADATPSNCSM